MRFRCKQSMLQVVFIVAAAVPAMGWAQAEQTVRIGNAGPLTGGAAHWGKDNENGARLAVEDRTGKGS